MNEINDLARNAIKNGTYLCKAVYKSEEKYEYAPAILNMEL